MQPLRRCQRLASLCTRPYSKLLITLLQILAGATLLAARVAYSICLVKGATGCRAGSSASAPQHT
eukprot:4659142-Pleurochrysis_carterae.AAC.1